MLILHNIPEMLWSCFIFYLALSYLLLDNRCNNNLRKAIAISSNVNT